MSFLLRRPTPGLLLLFLLALPLAAQQRDSLAGSAPESAAAPIPAREHPVIGLVRIEGNLRTDDRIIRRELTLSVGDTISQAEVDYCVNRIYSLGLFNKVDITWLPLDTTILLVRVDERWFLYPVPMAGIVDHNFSQWFYGLGVKHENLTGGNEKLFAGFVLGYNPWVRVDFSDPWIFGKMQMFMQTIFSFSHVENKSLLARGDGPNFFERHYSINQLFGKRYDQYRRSWFQAGFSYVDVSAPKTGRTLSPDGIDRFLFAGIGGSLDTRDLREYPTDGIYAGASVTKYGFGESSVDYSAVAADFRGYRDLYRGLSICMRAFSVVTAGPAIPPYSHQFFGYGERIRGHFSEEMEGENIFGASLECRIPIVRSWYVHVPEVPIPQFATWRFGLYAALFMDAGTVWDRGRRLPLAGMPKGFGGGIHILLPYSVVFRAEHAWSETGSGEFIFDLGASF